MGALIRTANQFKNSDFPTPPVMNRQFIRLSIYILLKKASNAVRGVVVPLLRRRKRAAEVLA
jgi:hypothetical protein